MILTACTLTGVDDSTPLDQIVELSNHFPFVEWGFLYSPARQGQGGRYPSIKTLQTAFDTLPSNVRIALHVCGKGVPQLFAREIIVNGLVERVRARQGRVQLNFNWPRVVEGNMFTLEQMASCLIRFPTVTFITQHNKSNDNVVNLLRDHQNHVVLFDGSGGHGKSPDVWPKTLEEVACGYAGGLGPDNIATELAKIEKAAGARSFWIDMEGKLRNSSDLLNLEVAAEVLVAVDDYINQKGFVC